MAHVGEILAELHNDRELSQKELGRVLHIGGGTISCYERGSSLPNSDRIVQIADYFHVTMLAPGENRHSGPGENRQFWPGENRQSLFTI